MPARDSPTRGTCATLLAMRTLPIQMDDIAGMKVTVMGLGLHGGGLASAKFFYDRGAELTVTDLRDEKVLAPSIEALEDRNIRFVLGRHEMDDFSRADIVIKNPAVRRTSPFLAAARRIESDISVFLRYSKSPLLAVTGSKGKSSTATALHHGFQSAGKKSLLGGNITVSPLNFLEETSADVPVVLELSSWQLADLRGLGVLKPKVAILTAIMPDHMNYYSSMEEYVADKRVIYSEQDAEDVTICDRDSPWGRSFAAETRAKVLWYADSPHREAGGWLERSQSGEVEGYALGDWIPAGDYRIKPTRIVPEDLRVPGQHMRKNLLAAGLGLLALGLEPKAIVQAFSCFSGVEHRLEFFHEAEGVRWYNDSASTIPQAVAAALYSFSAPIVLITGGTDKNIDFSDSAEKYAKATRIVLLSGSGTEKLMPLLAARGLGWSGPYSDLDSAIAEARRLAKPGSVVLFSPGCTSFGMFLHEFDRGKKFKTCVAG
ncbi:MAG: UDP-N-acetylmuramoylalanine--D-glutamate ligase [Spirochaetes bacterium]|nr:MAG: UDP-N-acetylmuramoylalanine--D-glutamate ligase [Spirochaetota bacterium]